MCKTVCTCRARAGIQVTTSGQEISRTWELEEAHIWVNITLEYKYVAVSVAWVFFGCVLCVMRVVGGCEYVCVSCIHPRCKQEAKRLMP